jgi:hypothetical protein
MTVVEVEPFPARARAVWSDEELLDFTSFIARNPEVGNLIVGTGGVRKVRWSRGGSGKRGGVRVIYYFRGESLPLFLLTVYSKSKQETLTPGQLKAVVKLAALLEATYGKP